jgi:cell division protein FtsQ
MKRPEGFDPPRATPAGESEGRTRRGRKDEPTGAPPVPPVRPPVPAPAAPPSSAPASAPAASRATPPTSAATRPVLPSTARPVLPGTARPSVPATEREPERGRKPVKGRAAEKPAGPARRPAAATAASSSAKTSEREARRALKRAARERRRFERGEIKRFTRRARNRRVAWLSVAGIAAVLVTVLLIAVYSPLLALRTVTVDGTSRVDSAAVVDAVDGQIGTPLALVDYDSITRELAEFPLIRSYVTEVVPPDTLVVHIVERAPVVAIVDGAQFDLLDPAGIVVQSSDTRPEGFPLVDIGGKDVDSPAFGSVVEVLLSLPAPLLAEVDTISASTKDDVRFVLRGVGQSVVWGSSDDSAYKASTLAAMIATRDPAALLEYDVSAPGSVVVTPR